ncbi:MAG TPA: ChbG/HpnK family deacetylase [Thermoanaerobaculia bacterium]|nr:ChbG/HpnK family deacetylase [Thermoanaerobaculia bacterium]
MSLLVVNADDLGVSRGANLGTVRAHREGIVTSASLAVTTPFYEHAVESCVRACPDLGIGLHFTLTSGRPVSPPERVPLLIDRAGFFRWRFLPLLARLGPGSPRALLDQIELELEAQLHRMLADGIEPDHIDGERHVHLLPGVFERVAAAARRHRVPFVRVGRDLGVRFLRAGHAAGLVARGGFLKSWLIGTLSRRARSTSPDLRSAEQVASYLYSGRLDLLLRQLLHADALPGVTEVMVHPGVPEESRSLSLGNAELERYVASEDRRHEMDACIEARQWTGAWTLTNFRRLAGETRT